MIRCLYLYSHLELFMFPLQLLSLRQRAGIYHAGIQHGLAVTNPTQHLDRERFRDEKNNRRTDTRVKEDVDGTNKHIKGRLILQVYAQRRAGEVSLILSSVRHTAS